jgi:hypothetical protein
MSLLFAVMRASGYRVAAALLAALCVSCGSRAALEGPLGCELDSECEGNGVCRLGNCVSSTSFPSGGAAGAPAGIQLPPVTPSQGGSSPAGVGQCSGAGSCSEPIGNGGTGSGGTGSGGAGTGGAGGTIGTGFIPTGGTSSGGGAGGSVGSSGSGGTDVVTLPPLDQPTIYRRLPGATAIVASPTRDVIYVAVGPSGGDYADSIIVLDPISAEYIGGVRVGPNPDRLAISDDGTTLWAALHDRSSVLEIDVSSDVVSLDEYVLPEGDFAPRAHAAGPMVLLPGTTDSLAVTLHVDDLSPSLVGVVLLDRGVARPTRLPGHTGASRLTRGPSGYLFGYNNLHGGFGFYVIDVSPEGLHQTEYSNLISGFETDITYADGFVFSTAGDVIDVREPAFPYHAGRLPYAGPVYPEVSAGNAWILSGAESHAYPADLQFAWVDLRTFQPRATALIGSEILMPRNLIRSNGGVFAFIADDPEQTETGFEFDSGVYLMRL